MALPSLLSLLQHGHPAPPVPPHDYQVLTYIAAGAADDDDVATITYYRGGSGGVVVAILTFTYAGITNNVATIAMTLP